ncbi:MAG: DUF4836 family protein [Chitinophagaceae bacterium]|nr:DUF4836 family protein [Chitinophagaceae bacterium]
MRRNSLLILPALALLFAACGKKAGNSGLLVPKDANIVVHINSSSLTSKLSWDEIRQTNWFKEMSNKTTDSTAQQLLADPGKSGIDTKADLVFFMRKQGAGNYMVFQGKLKSASDFEKLLVQIHKDKPREVKKDGDFSYMAADEKGVVLWNKSNFAYVANAETPDMGNKFQPGTGTPHAFLDDSLRIFGQQALTLKSSDNLDADSRFADLVKDGSDVHIWTNMSGYAGNMGGMMSMMKLNLLTDGNVSAISVNFDNGKISAKSKSYYNEEMSKLLANHKPENISAEMINRIPSSNVVGVIAFNYPPKGLQELLRVLGVDGIANGFLADMNYSIEEFVKANKGDVLLAVTDLTMMAKQDTISYGPGTKPYVYSATKPDLKILFAASVNDKAAFEKLITLAWQATKGMTDKMPPISYKLENNWFAASNSQEHTDKFLAGGNSNLPFVSKITGHPMGMYLDLNKLITSMGGPSVANSTDSTAKASYDLTIKMWKDVVASGGEYKDKSVSFDMEVNLVDQNTNSLKQLNQYFDKLSVYQAEKKKKFAGSDMPVEEMKEVPPVVAPQ